MALGANRALRDAGRRVLEDVSVVGFDDVPEAAYFDPPLTTVQQDFVALGHAAVDGLTKRIESPELVPQQRVLYPAFVVRASTARVAADGGRPLAPASSRRAPETPVQVSSTAVQRAVGRLPCGSGRRSSMLRT